MDFLLNNKKIVAALAVVGAFIEAVLGPLQGLIVLLNKIKEFLPAVM